MNSNYSPYFYIPGPCFFEGKLPKELGKLVNLETFNVMGNSIGGEL